MGDSNNQINYNNGIPYYLQVKEVLFRKINSGELKAGDSLPSQSELCDQFGVSRTVIRQALNELENDGRIIQHKGRVAQVKEPKITGRMLERLSGTYQDIIDIGYVPINQVLKQHVIKARKWLSRRLDINIGEKIIEIKRLRYVNHEPFVLIISYIPYDLAPKFAEIDLTKKSLLSELEKEYGITIASSRRSIETRCATENEARLLEIEKGSPLLIIETVSYMENGRAMGTTRSLFRGDRARFDVDISPNST